MILDNFSLLFPPGVSPEYFELGAAAQHDLNVEHLVSAFSANPEHQKEILNLFSQLLWDPAVISYRLDVIDALMRTPQLVERLTALLPVIDALVGYAYRAVREISTLHEVNWRVGELQNIVDCIEALGEMLRPLDGKLSSQGLCRLQEEVQKIQGTPTYQSLVRELPDVLSRLRACASITIGVNLDASLRPVQAVLLSVNDAPFTDQSLLNRLFRIQNGQEGIAPLHSVPQREVQGHYAFRVSPELGWAVEPMMVPLFADLAKVLEKVTAPIVKRLRQYTDVQSRLFTHLRQGLIFYLGAVRLMVRLHAQGLPVCRPELAPGDERVCAVKEAYNVNLALQHSLLQPGPAAVTTNDIAIGEQGRILILTGPNQGGKTTYMSGVGLVQILAQVGCYVPGRQARISPVDHIFTHFPLEEKPETDAGRFGEEAQRLARIFEQVPRHSLVLLNESLSSTSFGESLYLAEDLTRLLRRVGARSIFSTHLHELANRVEALNASVPGDSEVISLVASAVDSGVPAGREAVRRTYKVEARPPLGQSYAREIAARYGISYQLLEEALSKRGVL